MDDERAGGMYTSVPALAVDPTVPSTVDAGTNVSRVLKSTDGGASWAPANAGLGGFTANTLVADAAIPGTVYAGTGAGVFESTDQGASWTSVNAGLTNLRVYALAIEHWTTPEIYAGTAGGGVFRSTNAGANWSALNSGLTNVSVNALAVAQTLPPTVYAGTANGVFSYAEPVVCVTPSGLVNNTAADLDPCAKTGVVVAWSEPTAWGDSGTGTRSFDVLRNEIPIATGLGESTLTFTDGTGVEGVDYTYAVRANNGCGLSAVTVGATALDLSTRPVIQTQPASQTLWAGHSAAFQVVAASAAGYRWYGGLSGDTSQPIVGATSSIYVTPKLNASASFWVLLSNACGTTASNTATVTLK